MRYVKFQADDAACLSVQQGMTYSQSISLPVPMSWQNLTKIECSCYSCSLILTDMTPAKSEAFP